MFSCEYCKTSNNTCFEEHPLTGASENNNKKDFLNKPSVRMIIVNISGQNMINMDSQGPKIGGNWPLTGHYLQRWSTEKIYQELGLDSLRAQLCCRKLWLFIRSWKMRILNIFSAWFLSDACYALLEICITNIPF